MWIAGVLTVWSMLYYLRRAWPLITASERELRQTRRSITSMDLA